MSITTPTAGTAPMASSPHTIPNKSTLSVALSSEWTKLRSVRSTVWALVLTAGFTIGLGALLCWTYVNRPERRFRDPLLFDPTRHSLRGVILAQLSIGVLGVLVMSSEYTTGMIRTTFAAVPRRRTVLLAKALVLGSVSFVVSMVAAFVAFFLGQQILSTDGVETHLSAPHVLRAVLGAGVFLTLIALFGLALGTIVRRTPGALAALFGTVLILPLIAQALPQPWDTDVGKFTPLFAGNVLYSARLDPDLLSPRHALMVLLAWVIGAFVIATVLLSRRDV